MNEIERRALLGAAGVSAMAAMARAGGRGPLDPPPGAVAGTGRTLDEVYNKIPSLPNGTADGRVQIPGGTSLVTISQPGSYVLTGDISVTAVGISITSGNVDLDLNGFRVISSATQNVGAITLGLVSNMAVRNGWLLGGGYGVQSVFDTAGILLEGLRIVGAHATGILSMSPNSRAWQVRRCHILDTGGAFGIRLAGTGNVIEETVVHGLHSTTGTPTYRGIDLSSVTGAGNIVMRCTISNDTQLAPGSIGLSAQGAVASRDNTVLSFSIGYQAGNLINGGGNV